MLATQEYLEKLADKVAELCPVEEHLRQILPQDVEYRVVDWHIGLRLQVVIWVTKDISTEVTPILRTLATAGYRQTDEPTDYPEIARRTWFLGPKVIVSAMLLSSKCQYRVVGYEQTPKYELQCTD